MNCENSKDQLVEYLKRELSTEEQLRIETHLAACKDCQQEVQQLKTLWLALEADEESHPSMALRNNFYRLLEQESNSVAAPVSGSEQGEWRRRFKSLWPSIPAPTLVFSFAGAIIGFLLGSGFAEDIRFSRLSPNGGEIAQIQQELTDLRDVMTLTLLRQDSIQSRLRGVDYALQSGSTNPQLISLLLQAAQRDSAGNVRLAALDALELHRDNEQVQNQLFDSLSSETSPLVQLRKAELLLNAAGNDRQQLLNIFMVEEVLDSSVSEFLQNLEQETEQNFQGGGLIEL